MYRDELYRALERLKNDGEIVNAYGGSENDIDHPDGLTLIDFIEYICEYYPDEKPIWMEAFFQVFNWQFAAMYEGVDGYYSNDYENSDYPTIMKVANYLKKTGYTTIAEQYASGIDDCKTSDRQTERAVKIENWVDLNTEAVWEFYLDILQKHKNDWPEI